jgi:Tfp pilus assembly protein PilN
VINKLNLASRPFRNRTLPYLIAVLLLGCTLAGAVLTFTQWRETAANNELAKDDLERMEAELKELNAKGELVQQSLSPAQKELMIAGHKLVANKEFGWSRLLADIERVLPGSVSASRINVENVYKEDGRIKAELEFAVLSKNYQGVLEMIDRMNNSGVFRASLRGQDRQKSETITYSEYTLHLIYQPASGMSLAPPTEPVLAEDRQTGGNQ